MDGGGLVGDRLLSTALGEGRGSPAHPPLKVELSVPLPTTGLTIGFGPGAYVAGSTYSWTSLAPITLGPAAFDGFGVRNFGAIPYYDPVMGKGTDNLPFFRAALAAMAASGNRSAKLLVDGHFYLKDTLVLTQTVVLEGTGMNVPPPFYASRSTPGTMLVFPNKKTGIRIRSASPDDNLTAGAHRPVLRNLTISFKQRS